jgi:hypothetical protein
VTSSLRFVPYQDSHDVPNIVVDGSPNPGTVLTLTHWPAIDQPAGLEADLSAQMAFAYIDGPPSHAPAQVVTNNHFDQDGLVGICALLDPEASQHRDLLIDVAAAGDFGTYRYRAAAQASMALATYGDPEASPIADALSGLPYPDQAALLYQTTLPLLIPMATDPDRFRSLWADEDENLTTSERSIATGVVTVTERADLDLAIVTMPEDLPWSGGRRFTAERFDELHPMAIQNATDRFRILLVQGRHYRYVDRYETWVQYRSRRPKPRVDLRPLAEALTALEPRSTTWIASAPSELAPTMAPLAESALDPDTVLAELTRHLATASAAWDPYGR